MSEFFTLAQICRSHAQGFVAVKRLVLQIDLVQASWVGGFAIAIAPFVCLPKTKRLVLKPFIRESEFLF